MHKKLFYISVVAGFLSCAGLGFTATAQPDDPIAGVLRQEKSSPAALPGAGLPVAPAASVPPQGAGQSPGGNVQGSQPIVLSARIGEHADRTRFVIELSDPVNLRTFTLTNPDRVVVDMPEVQWRLGAPPRPSGFGLVKSYRYGVFRKGNSRMVMDLTRPVTVSDPLVIPPSNGFGYRVVIDLFSTPRGKFAANAGWPADLKARETDAERLASLTAEPVQPQGAGHRVVVIDPGHGGLDSGTNGINGLIEKDLVLAEGLKLAKVLKDRGYIVHMTRDSDVFVPLPERVAIARKLKADLMISLHADSNPDPQVNGLSIYTLNDGRSDREAAALARRENQSDIIAGVDLSREDSPVAPILIDLAQRDTINRSSRFAETALGQLHGVTDILPRSPHRAASLAVLVAPDVPAVLIELGYLSNEPDATQMNTQAWRERVAEAIARAVERNFTANSAGTLP
ncbi:MAG TPA: N-acetylmuramoyl-L-alanine amidase [Rhizomicrobium sp.]|nr:N-acetylmuramoyl-L-alanine amidase [Rhizomicrobium sp.]